MTSKEQNPEKQNDDIIVDVTKLTSNQIVKNYKEMCLLLNEMPEAGNSKKAQLKNWERFFDYGRKGQKFIIEKIYDTPFPVPSNSNAIYVKTIELLLMHELSNKENYTCNYTKTNLFKTLGMINERYRLHKYDYDSPVLDDYPKWQISHFYNRTNQKLSEILFSALNSMKRRCLLMYEEQIMIHENNILRIATDEEKKLILNAQKIVLDYMGYSKIPFNKTTLFYNNVNRFLFKKYNWDYIYKEYKLIYNQQYMKKDIKIVENEIREEIKKQQLSLNCDIIDVINKQAITLYEKNKVQINDYEDKVIFEDYKDRKPFEYGDDYLNNQSELAELFLRIN